MPPAMQINYALYSYILDHACSKCQKASHACQSQSKYRSLSGSQTRRSVTLLGRCRRSCGARSGTRGCTTRRRTTDKGSRSAQSRFVQHWCRCISCSIPAILCEAGGASVRECRISPLKRATDDCAPYAYIPSRSSVCSRSDIVAVCDDGVTLRIGVREIVCGDVGHGGVWRVRDVYDQWWWGRVVGGVAAKECRAQVEAEIDERVLVWNVREHSMVLDGRVQRTLVGSHKRRSVWLLPVSTVRILVARNKVKNLPSKCQYRR